MPEIRNSDLYNHCGYTLSLAFDLSVPHTSAIIEPLLNVSAIGNQCPPLRALQSSVTRGFTCSIGEVLNTDTTDVPRCCKLLFHHFFNSIREGMPLQMLVNSSTLSRWNLRRRKRDGLQELRKRILPKHRPPGVLPPLSLRDLHQRRRIQEHHRLHSRLRVRNLLPNWSPTLPGMPKGQLQR